MPARDESRRNLLKGALTATAYAAPAILSIATAPEVSAATPALATPAPSPSTPGGGTVNPTVTFTQSGTTITGVGVGFIANVPYLFAILSISNRRLVDSTVILTDAAGSFTFQRPIGTITPGTYPALVNGGVIAVIAGSLAP